MKSSQSMGMNRTGLLASPVDAKAMVDAAKTVPHPAPTGPSHDEIRAMYFRTTEPIGTLPPPGSLKGVATATLEALKGNKATALLDKLGERLAFERTGTRLYQMLIQKLELRGGFNGGPTKVELETICRDEQNHFELLRETIEKLGADPTAMTPSADIHGVAANGWAKVLGDPRTDLREGLEIMLIAELVDEDSWESLVTLTEALGHADITRRLQDALAEEEEHLRRVRTWVRKGLSEISGVSLPSPLS